MGPVYLHHIPRIIFRSRSNRILLLEHAVIVLSGPLSRTASLPYLLMFKNSPEHGYSYEYN
jgi:hypothetical protein